MNRRLKLYAASAALALTLAAPSVAQVPKFAPPTPDAIAVRKLLEERFPGGQVKYIAKTPYFGLYEAMFEDKIVYVDSKVTYVLFGQIYDAKTKVNLTELKLRQINRIAWNELPLDLAMKKVKGDGSRRLVVFSDADCPFCARLEETLKDVDNITVYTFMYPIEQLHPDAARKQRLIWCSEDKVKAWDEFFANGAVPSNAGDCQNPIAATIALGQKLRVSATPTLIFADGSIVPGALPAENLEAELQRAEADAKKLAQAK
jgi:thiol:disulfide interchange protein DsbC